MKIVHAVVATALVALAGCAKAKEAEPTGKGAEKAKWQPREASGQPVQAASQPAALGGGVSGKVVETMNSGGYTYVQVDAGAKGKVWAAGPNTPVKVGDTVGFAGGQLMQGFVSNTLNRTFDKIYFVGRFEVGGGSGGAPASAGAASAPAKAEPKHPTANVDVGKIEKLDGGLTVAEVFAKQGELSGKKVRLRAKVVKFNANIMGKNWLHVQDGSGAAGANDLTVTTAATAAVGDIVVLEGVVATNKDFGAGYKYPVLLEDAALTK